MPTIEDLTPRKVTLSEKGWARLMELLESPPKPTEALKTLMREK